MIQSALKIPGVLTGSCDQPKVSNGNWPPGSVFPCIIIVLYYSIYTMLIMPYLLYYTMCAMLILIFSYSGPLQPHYTLGTACPHINFPKHGVWWSEEDISKTVLNRHLIYFCPFQAGQFSFSEAVHHASKSFNCSTLSAGRLWWVACPCNLQLFACLRLSNNRTFLWLKL